MMNFNSLVPAVAIIGIGAFVMIPVNLALSAGVTDNDENPKDRLPLALIFVAYGGAVIAMCIGNGTLTSVVLITIFLAATWPLTLWRLLCAPRNRPGTKSK